MTRTSDSVYLRNRAKLKRQADLTCVVCGQPIDTAIKWPDPMSFTADHVTPIDLGGDNRGPLQATHAACNRRRSTQDLDAVRHNPQSRQHY